MVCSSFFSYFVLSLLCVVSKILEFKLFCLIYSLVCHFDLCHVLFACPVLSSVLFDSMF